MAELIQGKVAQILNSREVAINVGIAAGVEEGMYFDILADPDDIVDPDTNEVLGSIDRPKVRVRVTHVQEKLSVAATFRKKRVNIGGTGLGAGWSISELMRPPKWVTEYETLRTEEKTWEDLDEEESYVNVGDLIVQVVEKVDDE